MRVNLFGLYWSEAKLAGGKTKRYYYAWKGGPRITAPYGTPDFIRQYNEAIATRQAAPEGIVFSLIVLFKSSSEFITLGGKTKKDYLRYIKLIGEEFGDMPLAALDEKEARGEFKAWRDKFAANPRKADYAWTVLARIFSVAKEHSGPGVDRKWFPRLMGKGFRQSAHQRGSDVSRSARLRCGPPRAGRRQCRRSLRSRDTA